MKYMFFDIECCDGYHICSFGYVIVNEKFEVLKKEDILINPKTPFRVGRANFDPTVSLAYKKEEFCRNPDFAARYDLIRRLLVAQNQRVLGHAAASDLKYLNIEYTRYHKKQVEVNVYDTQKIYADNFAPKKLCSLNNILKALNIDIGGLVAHKSCDDAELTMFAVKEMCQQKNFSLDELLHNNSDCVVNYRRIKVAKNYRKNKRSTKKQ